MNPLGGQSDGESRRMFPYPVPPIEENVLDEDKLLKAWDAKKLPLSSSRPKSCEVPGINVFASPEQPSTPVQGVPQVPSTGGSLPDLSSLHFPSPLPTPLDQDEPGYPGSFALSGGGSTGNLASTLTQLGIDAAGGNGGFHHPTPGLLALLQNTLSNPHLQSSLSNPNIQSSLSSHSFSSASLHSSLSNPSLQSSLGSSPSLPSSLSSQSLHSSLSNSSLQSGGNPGYNSGVGALGSGPAPYALSTSPRRRAQLLPLVLPLVGESRRLHSKQFSPTISPTLSSISQGIALDTSKLPLDQRLPPYPLSQTHQQQPPGPGQLRLQQQQFQLQNLLNQNQQQHFGSRPMGTQPNVPLKSESAVDACGQTSLQYRARPDLDRQAEQQNQQINLNCDFYNDVLLNSLLDDPYLSLQLTGKPSQQFIAENPADGLGQNQFPCNSQGPLELQGPGDPQQLNNQNQNYSSGDGRQNVPNIILTGDSPPGLSKEITSALSHVPGFEMDPFSLDEQLRIDPLSLDMLEGDLMLADPAVEDSFRSDRLK